MVGNTLEIANFRLSQGTTKELFLEGVKAFNTFLTAQEQAAFKLSMEGDYHALRQFIGCLDMASGSMKHGEVLHVTG